MDYMDMRSAIGDARKKVLDIVEIAYGSTANYQTVKRHIQDAFGRSGLEGKLLGMERDTYEKKTPRPNTNTKTI